jgi:AcrR family transcriptional regulator
VTSASVTPRRVQRSERPAKGDSRERALIETAERLLEAGEFEQASVADLTRAANISRATFYFYFASKQAVLASVVDAAITTFNSQILSALDETGSPSKAVRSTVTAAAELWWDHRAVLIASFELGSSIPEVYDRTMANQAIVREPTVELLRRYGTVPEAGDPDAALALVTALTFMSERSFYHLMRDNPSIGQRDQLADRLARIWLRSFGLPE